MTTVKRKKTVIDAEEPALKKKLSLENDEHSFNMKELSKLVGLSEFMTLVAIELLDKSQSLTLIDIVCPNEKIRALNKEAIDTYREEYAEKKGEKSATDDDIRKFIVEKAEKILAATTVRIAGSDQHEKMSSTQRDKTMVSDFLGYAQTSHGYFVYAYFIGPSSPESPLRLIEVRNPRNWLAVNKNHLSYFHKRIRDHTPYHSHTKYDQTSFQAKDHLGLIPAYDPRFLMHKWLNKDGKPHKPLLLSHKALLDTANDFTVKYYEEAGNANTLHYYDEKKPDILQIDLTMDVEEEEKPRFNVSEDRLKQQAAGYRYTDKELCHVSVEEFPSLSRIPLPREIDLSLEEFLKIAKHVHVNERQPLAPESYVCDPLVMVKAAMMALNIEMQVRRTSSLLGDEKLLILEADNIKPIMDYISSHKSCTDEIKAAVFRCLLSLMATELMTREEPSHIKEIFEKRNGDASFKPLDK